MLDRFEIELGGLGDWHVGQAPDHARRSGAINRGIDISGQSARQIAAADFDRFDLLLAMDDSNYSELIQLAPSASGTRSAASSTSRRMWARKDVPDPFYGESEGFDHALDLIEQAARGLLAELLGDRSKPTKKGV